MYTKQIHQLSSSIINKVADIAESPNCHYQSLRFSQQLLLNCDKNSEEPEKNANIVALSIIFHFLVVQNSLVRSHFPDESVYKYGIFHTF